MFYILILLSCWKVTGPGPLFFAKQLYYPSIHRNQPSSTYLLYQNWQSLNRNLCWWFIVKYYFSLFSVFPSLKYLNQSFFYNKRHSHGNFPQNDRFFHSSLSIFLWLYIFHWRSNISNVWSFEKGEYETKLTKIWILFDRFIFPIMYAIASL